MGQQRDEKVARARATDSKAHCPEVESPPKQSPTAVHFGCEAPAVKVAGLVQRSPSALRITAVRHWGKPSGFGVRKSGFGSPTAATEPR